MNFFTKYFFSVILLFFSVISFSQSQYIWTQKASLPASARHRCALLNIGGRAYLGMGHYNSVTDVVFDDWWQYDPGTNSWTQKANFGGGKRLGTSYFTIGNKGYVGTGRDGTGTMYSDLWEYDPSINAWTQKSNFSGAARRVAVGFAIGNKGYIGTGEGNTSYLASVWEYDPSTDSWTQKASYPPGGRFAATGFSIGNKGYLGTGEDNGGNSTNDFYEYDPSSNAWTQKANVPGVTREAACGFSHNGKGYIGTGEDFQSGNSQGDFYEYDPVTNVWDTIAKFGGTARRYMKGVSLGTRAYAGTGTNGNNFADWWEYGNVSGIDELSLQHSVLLYPNPMKDFITVAIDAKVNLSNCKIKIADINGKILKSVNEIPSHEIKIYRENLSSGTYFLQLVQENSVAGNFKFIVQ